MIKLIHIAFCFSVVSTNVFSQYTDPKINIEPDGDINMIGSLSDSLVLPNSETLYNSISDYYDLKSQDFLIHMDSSRSLVWYKLYGNGTFGSFDVISDSEGNVYLGGLFIYDLYLDPETTLQSNTYEYVLIKYDSKGRYLWNRHSEGIAICYEFSLGIDSADNIYFAGLSRGPFSFRDNDTITSDNDMTFIVKFDPDGNKQWLNQIEGSSKWCFDIDVSESGDAVVIGHFSNDEPIIYQNDTIYSTRFDGYVLKIDSNGNSYWLKGIRSLGIAVPNDLAFSSSGQLTVVGGFEQGIVFQNIPSLISDSNASSLFIINFDTEGVEKWALKGEVHRPWYSTAKVAATSDDNIFLVGEFGFYDEAIIDDISIPGTGTYLLKLDSFGNIQLMDYIPAETFLDLSIDGNNCIYVLGAFSGFLNLKDRTIFWENNNFYIAKFDSNLNLLWIDIFQNKVTSIGHNTLNDGLTLELFPNPATDELFIKIPGNSLIQSKLEIVDLNGKLVYQNTLNDNDNRIRIANLDNGVYIVYIRTKSNIWRSRLIKL